jgi:hypothetical protein
MFMLERRSRVLLGVSPSLRFAVLEKGDDPALLHAEIVTLTPGRFASSRRNSAASASMPSRIA